MSLFEVVKVLSSSLLRLSDRYVPWDHREVVHLVM